jgi:NET1-associated nuclear protein 1 (U3 small nucleolar RNA-associated protein 17)
MDDNATMVLSTSEMKPTTYISGLQALAFSELPPKDSLVRRVERGIEEISHPPAAAISPAQPSQLFLCVGGSRLTTATSVDSSMPFLQIFDLSSFQSLAKQAVVRADPTNLNITPGGLPITEPRVALMAFSQNGDWLATVDEWQPPEEDVTAFVNAPHGTEVACRERREIYLKFWEVRTDERSLDLVSRVNEAHFTTQSESIFDIASDKSSTRFATVGDDGVVRLWAPKLRHRNGLAAADQQGRALKVWACSRVIPLGGHSKSPDELFHLDSLPKGARSGALSFSEDGSILFVALGHPSQAIVYVIDADSGEIRNKLSGLFTGEVRAIRALSSCLILLSDDLRVYDVVADELRYGITLGELPQNCKQLRQLAVDYISRTFAISVPVLGSHQRTAGKGTKSELAVFTLDESEPSLIKSFQEPITCLLPATGSPGFIALDTSAQVWSIVEATDAAPVAQALADMKLDVEPAAEQLDKAPFISDGEGDAASEDDIRNDSEEDEKDDDAAPPMVIAPQRLADIFDAAPAFAMPPIGELFSQVTELFASGPLTAAS